MQLSTVRYMRERLVAKHPELAGRFDKAAVLLVSRRIGKDGAGHLVESEKQADTWYQVTLSPRSCECADFAGNKAPDGWCKHLLAVAVLVRGPEVEAERERNARNERRAAHFFHEVQQGAPIMAAYAHARGAA